MNQDFETELEIINQNLCAIIKNQAMIYLLLEKALSRSDQYNAAFLSNAPAVPAHPEKTDG